MEHVKGVLWTPRVEVKVPTKVLQNFPVKGKPAEELHCRNMLFPLLGSGSAALPTKKKASQQQKHTNASWICNCSILRVGSSIMVCSFAVGTVHVLDKSSRAAELHLAHGQRFSGADPMADSSLRAGLTTCSLLQQINTAADTYSLHLHTQCRGFSLQALMSPF